MFFNKNNIVESIEIKLLYYVCKGHTTKSICSFLQINEVKYYHIKAILKKKFNASDDVALVYNAIYKNELLKNDIIPDCIKFYTEHIVNTFVNYALYNSTSASEKKTIIINLLNNYYNSCFITTNHFIKKKYPPILLSSSEKRILKLLFKRNTFVQIKKKTGYSYGKVRYIKNKIINKLKTDNSLQIIQKSLFSNLTDKKIPANTLLLINEYKSEEIIEKISDSFCLFEENQEYFSYKAQAVILYDCLLDYYYKIQFKYFFYLISFTNNSTKSDNLRPV